nr:hypothetical protein [Tanacetum cinerariifolium]
GSRSGPTRRRTYVPREQEDAKQRLIDDYFGNYEFLPKYPEENFRRRQRYEATGRLSIGPILKCTSIIRQLVYDTAHDAFDEYLQIVKRTSRECLDNFIKCIHVLYVEKFLRKPTAADIQKTYELHEQKHGLPGMLESIDSLALQVLRRLGSIFTSVYAAVQKLKKAFASQRKPETQCTHEERKAANLDQLLKSLIMYVLPDDQMS